MSIYRALKSIGVLRSQLFTSAGASNSDQGRTLKMKWGAGVLWVACCSVAMAASELRKPAPDTSAQPYRQRLTSLLITRYPQLLTQPVTGTPVVTVLFEADGSVAKSDLEVRPTGSEPLTASEGQFYRFGNLTGRLRYVGAANVDLPVNKVVIVFGGLDTRNVDRALVEHYFPQALKQGAPPHEALWILFDHEGRALRTGEEQFDPASLRERLESRYPGIRTVDMTVSQVFGQAGQPVKNPSGEALQLDCVWLANGSAEPE